MLAMHDYIIAYKSTPRSRIFRRYINPLDTIEEVTSDREASIVRESLVNSIMTQPNKHDTSILSIVTIKSNKRFVYNRKLTGKENSNSLLKASVASPVEV
jgi:hypothetical protein